MSAVSYTSNKASKKHPGPSPIDLELRAYILVFKEEWSSKAEASERAAFYTQTILPSIWDWYDSKDPGSSNEERRLEREKKGGVSKV